MATRPRAAPVRRVVVPVRGATLETATVTAAMRLARSLSAELTVLYVEDLDQVDAASLPFVREIHGASGAARRVDAGALELRWREHAARSRAALAAAATRERLRWHVEVRRGRPDAEIAAATRDGDLVLLSNARRLASEAPSTAAPDPDRVPAAVLLLARPLRARGPILVLYDGSPAADAALPLAEAIAEAAGQPLVFLLAGADADQRARWRSEIDGARSHPDGPPAYVRTAPAVSLDALARLVERLHVDAVVAPRRLLHDVDPDGAWTERIARPLLVVGAA